MTDPIRKQILDGIETVMGDIDGTGNYRTTVETIEQLARGFDELGTRNTLRPYIGIVGQGETYAEHPGYLDVTWTVVLLCHLTCANTPADVALKCADIKGDVRRALYNTPDLGVTSTSVRINLVSSVGSEGSKQAAQEGIASVSMTMRVFFQEDLLI